MNTLLITQKTENMTAFIDEVLKAYEKLGLSFILNEPIEVKNRIVLKEQKNQKIVLKILVFKIGEMYSDNLWVELDRKDERLADTQKILDFVEKTAIEFPEGRISLTLMDKFEDKNIYYVGEFTDDEHVELCYSRINAFCKKRISGKPFVIYKTEARIWEHSSEEIRTEPSGLELTEACTKKIHNPGVVLLKRKVEGKTFYNLFCGKWPDAGLGVNVFAESIKELFENLKQTLKDRGYEVVRLPEVSE
jgi:hypothetical protein